MTIRHETSGERNSTPIDFSTSEFAKTDQFEAWRQWFWPILDMTPGGFDDEGFVASNRAWNLGGLAVSRVCAPSTTVTRTKTNIARAPVDHWVLSYCRDGQTLVQTRDRLLEVPAGIPYIWSLGEPSVSERTQVDRIQILLPRDMFRDIGSQLDALRGTVLDTPAGIVFGQYMDALGGWLSKTPPEVWPLMGEAVRNMIAACLAPSADRDNPQHREMNGFLAERVRRAVRTHIRSPSLGPELLCRVAGISRSTLYRLFAHSGGVVHYIRQQRLLQAYAALSDPLVKRSIKGLSEELCFSDASSFTRAFRQEFGCSPIDVRSAAGSGNPVSLTVRSQRPLGTANFVAFLRGD